MFLRMFFYNYPPNEITFCIFFDFFYAQFKKMLYIWSVIPRRGCLHIVGGGSRHIKKAFIDALFWRVETSQLSDCVQDLATVDVLRDIDYPSCAYLVRLLRICVCAHAYLNYVAREYIYIRRGLRVVGLTQWAMRRPQLVERQQSDSTLFLYA